MKILRPALFIALGLVARGLAQNATAPNEGLVATRNAGNGAISVSWWGKAGRTYFLQHNPTLVDPANSSLPTPWVYLPNASAIKLGANQVTGLVFPAPPSRSFYRLKYTDVPTTDPQTADFDGDSVGNAIELAQGTDPFGWIDADSDGLPDDWEVANATTFGVFPRETTVAVPFVPSGNRLLTLKAPLSGPVQYSIALQNNLTPFYGAVSIPLAWEEISVTGTRLNTVSNSDDGGEAVSITGFAFPFYGQTYSQCFVSTNGTITFGSTSSPFGNISLPSTFAPRPMIAPFWDDLDTRDTLPNAGGAVFVQQFSDRIVVQYDKVARRSETSSLTFQVVLRQTGVIEFRYLTLTGTLNSCTVGVQNAAGTSGQQIATVQSNSAHRVSPATWLAVTGVSGTIPAGGTATATLQCTPEIVSAYASLQTSGSVVNAVITHNGPGPNPITVPVTARVIDHLEDADGDRIPNVYENVRGFDPANAASVPAPDYFVDPVQGGNSSTDNIHSDIGSALVAAQNLGPDYPIIRVKPGIHYGSVNLTVRRVLLLAEASSTPTVLSALGNGETVRIWKDRTVLDGFTITHSAAGFTGTGVLCTADGAGRARLVNCLIRDNVDRNGGGLQANQGETTLAHCTLVGNRGSIDGFGTPGGHGVRIFNDATVFLRNSILWNGGQPIGAQVHVSISGLAQASASIIKGGELGASASDPLLDRYGGLTAQSPAIGAALPLAVAATDAQGDSRASLPDIGADQYRDQDGDGLPDWWEQKFFANLGKSGSGDDDTPTPDGLINQYEFAFGTDPRSGDSNSNGIGDYQESIFTFTDPWYPANLLVDADGDGLSAALETFYGTSLTLADSNGDGLRDGLAVQSGLALAGDSDGDGLSNATELALGTNPFAPDTDGDGRPDATDYFPLDRTRWLAPSGTPGDTQPPGISLDTPPGAIPL